MKSFHVYLVIPFTVGAEAEDLAPFEKKKKWKVRSEFKFQKSQQHK